MLAAVYAVPDPVVGDQVMAALQLRPGAVFDAEEFAGFLAAQGDLGTKWAPRFVRVCPALPVTATSKVLVRTCGPSAGTAPTPCGGAPGAPPAHATGPSEKPTSPISRSPSPGAEPSAFPRRRGNASWAAMVNRDDELRRDPAS